LAAFVLAGTLPAQAQYASAVLHAFEDPPRYPEAALVKGSDGALYGTTSQGGPFLVGTIFRVGDEGSGFTILRNFANSDGAYPGAALVGSGGVLYGTTRGGGTYGYGTVFKISEDGSGFTILHNFNNTDGASPYAALIRSGGILYGAAFDGGIDGGGTVFRIGEDGSGFTILHDFDRTDGSNPYGPLVSSGGILYGTTINGGTSVGTGTYLKIGSGTVFKIGEDGSGFTVLHNFDQYVNNDGSNPYGGLVVSGGLLYGTTGGGGTSNYGNIFRIGKDGSGFTILHEFDNTCPRAGLVSSGGTLYGTAISGDSSVHGIVFKIGGDGSGFSVVHTFSRSDGHMPWAALLAADGFLYGAALGGGKSGITYDSYGGYGTLFRMKEDGSGFVVLHNFNDTGGVYNDTVGPYPRAALLASGGVLYGTTPEGGTSGNGTIFKVGEDGSGFTVLHSFNSADGAYPVAALISSGGVLYGTAVNGGASDSGTVFRIGEDGSGFTVLHEFDGNDGSGPFAALVGSGGVLYGTAAYDGASGAGTLFRIGEDGSGFTILHEFDFSPTNGCRPVAALIRSGGVLYGTTLMGGSASYGQSFNAGPGTVFKIGEDGSGFTLLHSFDNVIRNGNSPFGALVRSGGVLYGTTVGGGFGYGIVFKIGEDGSGFTPIHTFNPYNEADTIYPQGSLIESDGVLYGAAGATEGGNNGFGAVFKMNKDGSGFEVIHRFANGDGAFPRAGLVSSGGAFYGATTQGGPSGGGVVFRLAKNPAVVHPSDGERLFGHAPYYIEWTAPDIVAGGGLDVFSSADGLTFDPIPECTDLDKSARSCAWLAPGPPTRRGRVRVVAHDTLGNSAAGVSGGHFTTAGGSPSVAVSAPNTVTSWNVGARCPIRWSHNLGPESAVNIELSRDGGITWGMLAAGVPNATAFVGQFDWVVSGPATTAAAVRVSWARNPDVADTSNTTFPITEPFVRVTSPAAGVSWRPGQTRVIRWEHNLRRPASVNIDISRDGGATWRSIVTNLPSSGDTTGSFTWLVTEPATATAVIRVSWATNAAANDSSEPFAIPGTSRRR
jgi:uncharacterized repeat protein (TIGR03803 family)